LCDLHSNECDKIVYFIEGVKHHKFVRGCEKITGISWPEQKKLTSDDILIILGDFGFIWDNIESKTETWWLNWLLDKKCTVCFIDGNHENFEKLNSFPVTTWNGGNVHIVKSKNNKHIYHLMRGQIFIIDGKTIFTMGGAESSDKERRIIGLSWWKDEVPNNEEWYVADYKLKEYDNRVDYILTHTAPKRIIENMGLIGYNSQRINDPTAKAFDSIMDTVQFKQWHFGHFHQDLYFRDKFFCHYLNTPYKLGE
jgi:hypothetical protein